MCALLLVACGEGAGAPDGGPIGHDARPWAPRDAGPDLCPSEGPLDASVVPSFRDRCIEGIVPMGFGVRWQRRSQRIARVGFNLDFGAEHVPDACPPGSTSRGATLVVEASGGEVADERDEPVAFFDYQVVGGRDDSATLPDGAVPAPRLARGSATLDLEDGADEGEGVALLDVSMLDGSPELAVVIDGFELTTEVAQSSEYPGDWDPVRGYASRGIGIAITSAERAAGTLTVRVRARFEAGIRRRAYWEPGHDRAVAVASTRAIVRVVAIGTDLPPTTGTVGYRYAARQSLPLEPAAACRPGEGDTMLVIEGAPGPARAVAGLTRFDVRLWPDEAAVGDLLRELSIRIRDLAYDPATGRATMRVEGYASNEGPLPRGGIDARIEADVALAQWDGDGAIELVSIAAPVEVGRTSVELPMR